jgi:glycosyltransferase involved in cell wall biosynthesis
VRVLIITDWPRQEGGVETYISGLRDALRISGDEVRLLTSSAGSAADASAEYVAFGAEHRALQAVLQIANPFAIATVRSAVRAMRPDVAHVQMFALHLSPAILWALSDVPTVLNIADYKQVCPTNSKLLPNGALCATSAGAICWRQGCVSLLHWLRDQPRYRLVDAWPQRVGRILACSRWMQEVLERERIISEYAPLPVVMPAPAFERAPAPNPTFVYCGRLAREKGLELLLRAFARLSAENPSARLRVVGDGPIRDALRQMVISLQLTRGVTFTGWRPPAEVERELLDAWAVVVPSLWAEPLGLVAIEAIIRNVPVIASREGGLAETVEPGRTGLLFPNGDEDGLFQCLRAVATGRAFPSRILDPEAVRRIADRHDYRRHVAHLRRVYESVRSA